MTVLYACESGSRAWGFESPDSDYDVRFLYAHPREWYLAFDVERQRDVIDRPIVDDIDCHGWDVRKALYLFTRTNGALIEWLNSPTRYVERGQLAARLRDLAPQCFNAKALCYHYAHMARRNAREYVLGNRVRLKKYFYVLRPLLAIRHIEQGLGVPPVRFESLSPSARGTSAQSMKMAPTLMSCQEILDRLWTNAVVPQIGHRQVRLPRAATGAATEVPRTG